jgi:hypothetical protein
MIMPLDGYFFKERLLELFSILDVKFMEIHPPDGRSAQWPDWATSCFNVNRDAGRMYLADTGSINYISKNTRVDAWKSYPPKLMSLAIFQLEKECKGKLIFSSIHKKIPHLDRILLKFYDLL